MKLRYFALILYSVQLLVPVTASAESNTDWEFELAPLYLWAINISGEVGLAGRQIQLPCHFVSV